MLKKLRGAGASTRKARQLEGSGGMPPRKILDCRPSEIVSCAMSQSYPIAVCVSIITALCGMCARSSPAESFSAGNIAPAQAQSGSGSEDKMISPGEGGSCATCAIL